ncbi:MAG: SafA/ExsA family spore coat assembly protein [Melioribacteraceae bacterium]|nr:SafA/ExsA family spore coat assembly protein [Melioribacteraceae bacterium]
MKKILLSIAFLIFIFPTASHAMDVHTVQEGDSLWEISLKYKIGLKEIIDANSQFENPDLIYPGQKVNVPNIDAIKKVEQEVIRLTNVKREEQGLAPLASNWELSRVARDKSVDMHENNYFSHTSPKHGSPFDMIKSYGISYDTAGENIAKGQQSPAEVVEAWWNSEGHKKNMINPAFTEIGVGFSEAGNCWTQMFIGK